MSSMAASWTRLTDSSGLIRFVDVALRGSGQVMFQNNPLTGLLFLVGIFWGAAAAGGIQVAIGATVALVVATGTAMLLEVDPGALRSGMYGFNGILVGVALPTFLRVDGLFWAYLVVGAVVSVFAMDAIATVLASWKTPALTFPFVLTSWLMVLAVTGFAQLRLGTIASPALPHVQSHAASAAALDPAFLLGAWLQGVSQVFLVGNAVTGAIFVVGLAVSAWRAAVFALMGSALALATALTLGASATAIHSGLFGFSAVLTAIALGAIFYPSSFRTTVVAALATVFTVIVQSAMNAGFSPVGLPTFTAPFVLVTWIFLLPHLKLAPVPHQKLVSATGSRGA